MNIGKKVYCLWNATWFIGLFFILSIRVINGWGHGNRCWAVCLHFRHLQGRLSTAYRQQTRTVSSRLAYSHPVLLHENCILQTSGLLIFLAVEPFWSSAWFCWSRWFPMNFIKMFFQSSFIGILSVTNGTYFNSFQFSPTIFRSKIQYL